MRRFASYDGTELGYRVLGDGPPLVCLPGGPGRAAEYLGDLGGLEKITAGDLSMEAFRASRPFYYGRWDEAARINATAGVAERHQAAREGYFAGASLDVPAIRAALTKLTAPVLLYAGEQDPMVTSALVAEAAPLFNDAAVGSFLTDRPRAR